VSAARADGVVGIAIADRGPGLDPEHFDPLRQGDGVGEGAGIGLFLSRELAEAQGGTISVAPREGGGCTVTVTVPAAAK
jgi:signal transduction histidine kinase